MTVPFCRNDCVVPAEFPAPIFNRPGLSHIAYRIGTYADIRAALLHDLDVAPSLLGWTHRSPDDPGIALLEGAAILGDVLTFYQELYANEAYLGTARWRESIAELVRLLGYRLAPGLGGRGTFALEVRGDRPVAVPAGFPVKAQLAGAEKPTDFQLTDAFTAYPSLSRFRLYRPRNPPGPITAGPNANRLEVEAVGGAMDPGAIASLDLQPGDRILLAPDASMFESTFTGGAFDPPAKTEILIVKQVERVLDRLVIVFEGALTETRNGSVAAYKLGRSFRHFGATAPGLTTILGTGTPPVTQVATSYSRDISATSGPASTYVNYYSPITATDMPLDREVDDLAAGGTLICEADVSIPFFGSLHVTVGRAIAGIRPDTFLWGNLTGATTVVTLAERIVNNALSALFIAIDIRTMRFHETTGPGFTLRAPTAWPSGPFVGREVAAYGTHDEMLALAGRKLLLVGDDGSVKEVAVSSTADDFALTGRDELNRWVWPVLLSRIPEPFTLDDFDEVSPRVTVYGNVAEGTQGKGERETILGSGDGRERFQTFKIPKAPLTYLTVPGNTPPATPELLVYVGDQLWKRAASLFARGPKEMIYIVREDAAGESWIQFGDGKTGSRLPSGLNNVAVQWRTGVNAFGALKESTTPQAGARLERLDRIRLPGVVSGGAAPEMGGHARETAPGRIQSLDRLVSLRDYETETMAIPGVARAAARWELVDGVPLMVLTVLMQSGRESEIASVRGIITVANRCRGPHRFPVLAIQGHLRWSYLAANVTIEPSRREPAVLAAITAALLGSAADDAAPPGLFTPRARRFGDPEYATRVEGIIQGVPGVVWTEVTGFGALEPGDDPALLALPPLPWAPAEVVTPAPEEILALDAAHLVLLPGAAAVSGGCA